MKLLSVKTLKTGKRALLRVSLCLGLLILLQSSKSLAQPSATLVLMSKSRSYQPNVILDQADAKIVLSAPAPTGGLDVYINVTSATDPLTSGSWSYPVHVDDGKTELELGAFTLNYWEYSDYIDGENIGLIYQAMSQYELIEDPSNPTNYAPQQTVWWFSYYNYNFGHPGPL